MTDHTSPHAGSNDACGPDYIYGAVAYAPPPFPQHKSLFNCVREHVNVTDQESPLYQAAVMRVVDRAVSALVRDNTIDTPEHIAYELDMSRYRTAWAFRTGPGVVSVQRFPKEPDPRIRPRTVQIQAAHVIAEYTALVVANQNTTPPATPVSAG